VIRYGNTLPKWIADTSKILQNPIIHRANPILQLALGLLERLDRHFRPCEYLKSQGNFRLIVLPLALCARWPKNCVHAMHGCDRPVRENW
jgi:hypothetical protein